MRAPIPMRNVTMNKKLWNTIIVDGRITEVQLKKWIDDSYKLVVEKLPKKDQNELLHS